MAVSNDKKKSKKKKQRINEMTEKQKLKGLLAVVGSIILALILVNLLIPSPDSKTVFMKSQCEVKGEPLETDAALAEYANYYNNFSLYGEENSIAEMKYVAHQEVTYYINNITGERTAMVAGVDESRYTKFTELICTMKVVNSVYGPLKDGEKIQIYFAPSDKDMARALIENKNIYVSVMKSTRSEGNYELSHGLDGVFYLKGEKILPASDVSPADYHQALMLGEIDNPVLKYKGMSEKQFKRAIKNKK